MCEEVNHHLVATCLSIWHQAVLLDEQKCALSYGHAWVESHGRQTMFVRVKAETESFAVEEIKFIGFRDVGNFPVSNILAQSRYWSWTYYMDVALPEITPEFLKLWPKAFTMANPPG